MHRLMLTMAVLAMTLCSMPSDPAEALPFSGPAAARAGIERINPLDKAICRSPPWYRGWERTVPFVCADFWWWPRYYYRGLGLHHRYHRHYRIHDKT